MHLCVDKVIVEILFIEFLASGFQLVGFLFQ
jgi:hypothetical protein